MTQFHRSQCYPNPNVKLKFYHRILILNHYSIPILNLSLNLIPILTSGPFPTDLKTLKEVMDAVDFNAVEMLRGYTPTYEDLCMGYQVNSFVQANVVG